MSEMGDQTPQEYYEELLADAPSTAVEAYMRLFDRLLLHCIAAQTLSKSDKKSVMSLWNKAVLRSIDAESTQRTDFMESTSLGRMAKYHEEPDGEDIRLTYLKAHHAAKTMIQHSIIDGGDALGNESGVEQD